MSAGLKEGLRDYERGDYASALRELEPLANKGNAWAQYGLGVMFEEGQGVPQDAAIAAFWYREAAEQGHTGAQTNLGALYADGQGVPQDYIEAASWYRKAAAQRDPLAEFNLAFLYEEGKGVPQDSAIAAVWYERADQDGGEDEETHLSSSPFRSTTKLPTADGDVCLREAVCSKLAQPNAASTGLDDIAKSAAQTCNGLGTTKLRGVGLGEKAKAEHQAFLLALHSGQTCGLVSQ